MKAVTKLMLMLVQVNGFLNSHSQTLVKNSTVHQSKSNMTTVFISCSNSVIAHIEFLVVELSELAKHSGRLVSVLGHGARQRIGSRRTDGLLVVGDISNEQGAELRDHLQTQRHPESEEEGRAEKLDQRSNLQHGFYLSVIILKNYPLRRHLRNSTAQLSVIQIVYLRGLQPFSAQKPLIR